MENLLQVGVITATHGIQGEVKVFPTTDDVKRFKKLKNCYLSNEKEKIEVEVISCKFFKQFAILKFKQFPTINDIEPYKRYGIWVTRDQAVPLRRNEYFITDIIGSSVVTEDNQELGILKDVLKTGANDVYVVEQANGKELLLPAIKQCVLDVDVDQKKITVHLMKGLLDL